MKSTYYSFRNLIHQFEKHMLPSLWLKVGRCDANHFQEPLDQHSFAKKKVNNCTP